MPTKQTLFEQAGQAFEKHGWGAAVTVVVGGAEDRRGRAFLEAGDGARRDRAQVAVTMNAAATSPRGGE